MCFVWISEQTAIISLYSINWLVFITETECVYCAVRAGYLNVIQVNFCMYMVKRSVPLVSGFGIDAKTLITNKMHKESFIVNCNTFLHVSTLQDHLQGELFVIVTLMLHFIVE
jgi:hypothetical protein